MQLQNQKNPFGEKFHLLRPSWGIPEVTWRSLGRSWVPLGASWEGLVAFPGGILRPLGLGASWGALGASWSGLVGVCWPRLVFVRFWARFGTDLEAQKAPQRGSKWSPKRTKIEHEIQHQKQRPSRPSWTRLGPVLGRFGVDLGVKNHQLSLVLQCVREHRVFEERRLGGASWTELGRIWVPKRLPKRPQIGPQMEPKWDRKTIKK